MAGSVAAGTTTRGVNAARAAGEMTDKPRPKPNTSVRAVRDNWAARLALITGNIIAG
jgi:hypothetical protein